MTAQQTSAVDAESTAPGDNQVCRGLRLLAFVRLGKVCQSRLGAGGNVLVDQALGGCLIELLECQAQCLL